MNYKIDYTLTNAEQDRANAFFAKIENDPRNAYHKMISCKRMRRERLRGILLATGDSPEQVDNMLRFVRGLYGSYQKWWDENMVSVVFKIEQKKDTDKLVEKAAACLLDELEKSAACQS